MIDPSVLGDAERIVPLLREAAGALRSDPRRVGSSVRLPARGRLVVGGDLHDHVVHLERLAGLARLDEPDHHLVVQELIHGGRLVNGMDFSHRMLGRVADLVLRHPGRVHPVLANHEIAQLTRAAVGKGGANATEQFLEALEYVYDDAAAAVAAALGEFIRAMPLALLTEDGVCCSHSLPNARLMHRFDPGVLDRPLEEGDYRGKFGPAYLMCWGREHADDQLDELAGRWGVRLFCIGHQPIEEGVRVLGPRLVAINSDHERGAAIVLDLARIPGPEAAVADAVFLAGI